MITEKKIRWRKKTKKKTLSATLRLNYFENDTACFFNYLVIPAHILLSLEPETSGIGRRLLNSS